MTLARTERDHRSGLLDVQRRILERIATGAPLAESLGTLVRLIEEQAPDMRCAVLLADGDAQRLSFVAAPNIPADYKEGIKPYLKIATDMGSCGTAAYLREPVYTADTSIDPRWAHCRQVALRNGLRAIWSTPILADDNTVLGTFAMYYGEPRMPSPEHIQLIDMATQMARVAIQSKRDEERLRASEELLRTLVEHTPAGVAIADLEHRLMRVNPAFARLLGYSEAELQGMPVDHFTHADDRPQNQALYQDLFGGKPGPIAIEKRYRRKDGTIVPVRVTATLVLGLAGEARYTVALVEDASDRRRAQAHLRLVIDTIPTMAWSLLPDGVVDFVNQRWLDYTGLSAEEALAQSNGIVHPEDLAPAVGKWALNMAAGQAHDAEVRLRRADGEYRWHLVRVVPLRGEDGAIVKWYGTSTDIEDRKRAEQASRQAAEELQALSRRLVELQEAERKALARELHDRLGETLTALSINLAMLEQAVHGDARAAARIEDSAALVKSTAATIENLVAELRPPMLDDHGLCAALEWYARQFSRRVGVAVEVRARDKIEHVAPQVEMALFRIAQEALTNVAKHARASHVAITLSHSQSEFVMSIADDGVGLPRAGQSSGLGLVTMRERAQAVGGTFRVEPFPAAGPNGSGTLLTVRVAL